MYTLAKDEMITSSLGLLAGMEMKGAIPFRTFKTTFSTTKYLKGYYNLKEGDIYVKTSFMVRGNHSDSTRSSGRLVLTSSFTFQWRCANF